ncbi:unnamed protein product [Parascedosporium putredinis]|uniref:Sugar phosphate transporter domain-containing protein n=1 Tax=Parascedosporium putredinis TaxID=1442378 RepID=A0A9P1M7T3_9PEZI|nr:unnamed protein product [Parascedosporium putredinis]CAI7988852.1 unnamed protein product [Parascedosporium putredinis]
MDTVDNSAFDPTVSRWAPRREHTYANGPTPTSRTNGHTRQKSLSEAFRTIRTRGGSVSQNVHEITDALKAPVSPVLVVLCILWYTSSVLTNTSSKSILMTLDKPATLTIVQFAFVSFFCLVCSAVASAFPHLRATVPALKNPIRPPTRDILKTTLPLALFQIGGHLLSSNATLLIPVSLVHTIKGLSPLFTVLAYRFIYDIRYPVATYISLVPLTLGVMLACSGKHAFGGELLGVLYALAAALIFVTQNIVSKRLFNEAAKAEMQGLGAKSRKLDKLNLLCYSAGLAFILTAPIWFWSEGIEMLRDFLHDGSIDLNERPQSLDHGRLVLEFIFNGTFHFGQNIIAFQLLSMVSPSPTPPTTWVQGAGIALTFLGLYMYDRASASNKADNKVRSMADSPKNAPILPRRSEDGLAVERRTSSLLLWQRQRREPWLHQRRYGHRVLEEI